MERRQQSEASGFFFARKWGRNKKQEREILHVSLFNKHF